MLPSGYTSNPYDTTRPKSFFGDRKRMMVEEIMKSSGGKSYNSSWNVNRKAEKKQTEKSTTDFNSILMLSPLAVYGSLISICMMWINF